MRRYEISPAIVAAMRSRAQASAYKEAGLPLFLEMPRYMPATTMGDEDSGEDRRFADPVEDDDDFY